MSNTCSTKVNKFKFTGKYLLKVNHGDTTTVNVDNVFVNDVFIGDSEQHLRTWFCFFVFAFLDNFEQLLLTGKHHQNLNLVFTIQVSVKTNLFIIFQPNNHIFHSEGIFTKRKEECSE